MKSYQQIKIGALMSYAMIFFNIIAGLLYTPWMIHQIGKSDYGLYILVTTFLNYFVIDFGMYQAINKLLSEYRAKGQYEKERDIIGVASKIYLILDIFVILALVIVYLLIDSIFANLSEDELQKFKTVYIIAGSFSVLSFPFGFLKGIFQSHEYYVQIKIFEFCQRIGLILLTVILLLCDLGLYALVIAYGLIPFVINVSKAIYLKYKGVEISKHYWNKNIAKNILSVSSFLLLIVLSNLFTNNISPTLIAAFSSTEEVALFGIAATLSGYTNSFAGAINGLFLPRVTEMYVKGQNKEIDKLTLDVATIQFLVTGFVAIGVLLIGDTFISVWVGNDFHKSYYIAILLIIPTLLTNLQQIESTLLFVSNQLKYESYMEVLTAITSVIVSVMLIPKIGALGAGVGICVGNLLFKFVGMNIIYHNKLCANTLSFVKLFVRFSLSYVLICVLFFVVRNKIFSINNLNNIWIILLTEVVIYSILYSTICLLSSSKEEKQLLRKLILKK